MAEKTVYVEPDSFFNKRDFEAMERTPTITPYRDWVLEEIESWLDELEYNGMKRTVGENKHVAYYIQMVDNHIEIGFANIKFIR